MSYWETQRAKPPDHHDHGPSPSSSPLKVTAASPLRIDIAELRSTADSSGSPGYRLGSPGLDRGTPSASSSGVLSNSSRVSASHAYYRAEIDKLESELDKAKKEAVNAYGLIELLASSDEMLAKYEASRSKERQLLKASKPLRP